MQQIINRKRYDTETSTLLSGDDFWDGHNWERRGRNTFLYRTRNGAYFAVHLTQWQGENDHIEPLSEDDAVALFEAHLEAGEVRVEFEEAFPGIKVEDAGESKMGQPNNDLHDERIAFYTARAEYLTTTDCDAHNHPVRKKKAECIQCLVDEFMAIHTADED